MNEDKIFRALNEAEKLTEKRKPIENEGTLETKVDEMAMTQAAAMVDELQTQAKAVILRLRKEYEIDRSLDKLQSRFIQKVLEELTGQMR